MDTKKIVYIEDDAELAKLVELILQKEGYIVKVAFDGQEGLEMVRNEHPDLILLDLMIPLVDGWDVYKHIQGNEEIRNIPVIILTAKSQSIDRVLGLHIAKVEDYISKPFHPDNLLKSVKNALSKK
jgi:two-component system, OmpR family, response regulator VicR